MAFSEALRLVINADTGGAVRGIQKVGATTDRELGRSSKKIDAWSRGLTTAGAGMVALGDAGQVGAVNLDGVAGGHHRPRQSTLRRHAETPGLPRGGARNHARDAHAAPGAPDRTTLGRR